ncbi:MAG: NAD(P)-dependent oxidoreductase [Desulforhopalus sp.]|nr:NAD(P)-dependent oxidoreductase [Desulforhopalus sp.]
MKARHVLVFGASGFIATYLIDELLSQGCKVTATDISDVGRTHYKNIGVQYINVDITHKGDFEALPKTSYDAVIHLAACQPANVGQEQYDPRDYITVNVIGTLNILDFCKENKVGKIIYASSHRNTQGLWAASKAIREEEGRGIRYQGEYAMFSISESAAQDCVMHYQAQYGLTGVIFRLPPVYGYGPHTEIFKDGKPIKTGFQIFIEKAMACQPLEIWGDPDVGRDIVYVKDVVSAFLQAIAIHTASGLFNIASGNYLTLRAQAETIAELFWGAKTQPVIIERPEKSNGMDSFLYDISKAKRDLEWSPKFSFKEMLIDYKAEMESERYKYLLDKRKTMFQLT